jgi:outer membrane protein assembly factor BamB
MVLAAVTFRATRTGTRPHAAQTRIAAADITFHSPGSLPRTVAPIGSGAVPAGGAHQIHGDARRSHRAHGTIARRPEVAWRFRADGPVEGQVVASPDETTLYVATLGGTLWALDRDGHARFHVSLGGRSYATPCVAPNGTVYAGSDGGTFFAILPDGRVAWKLETTGDADTGAALLEDGLVIFAAGSRVYGVRPDGTVAFRFRTRGKVFTAPALAPGADGGETRIIVGAQDDHVYALSHRGELLWATYLGHDVDGGPTIGDDGAIYVGTDGGEVVRLEEDGRIGWRVAVGGFVRGPLSLARDGDVFAGVYGPSPRLVRLSPGGEVLAGFDVRGNGGSETGVFGGALEDDVGAIAFGAQDGEVHVFDSDGTPRWSYDLHSDADAPVTLLGDGSLLVADYDGDVVALRADRAGGTPP